jgi:hypothetical protein
MNRFVIRGGAKKAEERQSVPGSAQAHGSPFLAHTSFACVEVDMDDGVQLF